MKFAFCTSAHIQRSMLISIVWQKCLKETKRDVVRTGLKPVCLKVLLLTHLTHYYLAVL